MIQLFCFTALLPPRVVSPFPPFAAAQQKMQEGSVD